jgi:NitT/TauT family transport system ATP-binding protein
MARLVPAIPAGTVSLEMTGTGAGHDESATPMLTLSAIHRRFPTGTEALRDASLRLHAGDFIALLGPSGCGKSTLLRMIAGLDRPDSGTLTWDAGNPPAPGEIGYVFQDATLLPWATTEENIHLPLRLRGIARAQAQPDIAAVLARVGLTGFENAHPRQLSGGMRMRVSIARALVTKPRLLLMDEPFAALDEFTRHRLQADLLDLWRDLGCTVVFVTHSIYEAAFLARRVILMTPRPGRIAQELASPLDPASPATRLQPAYAHFVADITHAMEAALP